ncbi:MAG: DUF4363 family protein [Clostridia bacterium]
MKKRLIIGIVLLFISTTISVASLATTKVTCDNVITSVDVIENYILESDNISALENAEELANNWETWYKILCTYISHDDLERTEISINAVVTYLTLGDYVSALILCEDIKTSANHIYTSENPGFWNIF